jgi:septal ring factor EnvC (AmiA/AmiB activator)
MPNNLGNIGDVDIPYFVAMVAQAKAFIIDKAMITLILLLITSSSSLGVAIYKLSEAEKAIMKQGQDIAKQSKHIQQLIIALNDVKKDVAHMKEDIEDLTESIQKHQIGHPIRITR